MPLSSKPQHPPVLPPCRAGGKARSSPDCPGAVRVMSSRLAGHPTLILHSHNFLHDFWLPCAFSSAQWNCFFSAYLTEVLKDQLC